MAPSALPTKPLQVTHKKSNRSAAIRHSAQLTLRLDLPERISEREYEAASAALLNRSLATSSPFMPTSLSPWVLTAQFTSSGLCSSQARSFNSSTASMYSSESIVISATAELSFPVSASPTTDSWLTSPVPRGTPHRSRRKGMYMDGNSSDSSSGSGILSADQWRGGDEAIFTVRLVASTERSLQRSVSESKPQSLVQERGWSRALKRWSRPASSSGSILSPLGKKPAGPRPCSQRPARKVTPATTPVSPSPWKPSAKTTLRGRRFRPPPDLPLPPVPALPKEFQLTSADFNKHLSSYVQVDSRLHVPGSRSGVILSSRAA